MKLLHLSYLIVSLLTTVTSPVFSQQDLSAEIWFDQQVGLENNGLLNGHEYIFPFRGAASHPFFFAEGGGKGEALYNSQWYPDILIMYDLFTNEVILKYQSREGQTKLMCFDQSHLQSFSLHGHRFFKIKGQFYDVLFQGSDWALLATRKKSTHVISGRVEFEEEVAYFIQQGDLLTEYHGKKTWMMLCPQQRDLQDFIKTSKIRLMKKNEEDLVRISAFVEKTCKQGTK